MDLRQLRYFVAIAEQGNFHRAAEVLNVAQSALSRHMHALSQQLGGALFERAPGGVNVTILGQVFYDEARDLLERADSAIDRTRRVVSGEIGRLVLGVNELGARNGLVTRCITACRQRHPEIELIVERMYSSEQVEALWAGRLDAGVMIDGPEDDSEFIHMPIGSDPFQIALQDSHPLASKAVLAPEDLAEEQFVGVRLTRYGPAQVKLMADCRQIGLKPRIVQEAANEQMQLALIRNGLGVGFVNRTVEEINCGGLVLRPLQGLNTSLELALVWLKSNRVPALRHFLKTVEEIRADSLNGE